MLRVISQFDKTINITDTKENKYEIRVQDILYIASKDKDSKTVFFSTPHIYHEKPLSEIVWKTRASFSEIIKQLGSDFFIQISSKGIIKKLLICGRDSDWKNIQLMGFNSHAKNGHNWIIVKLRLGKSFYHAIRKMIQELNLIELSNDNNNATRDVMLINPINIIYIKITKELKTIYLNHQFLKKDIKSYELKWKTRKSADEVLKYLKINSLVQISKFNIINLYYYEGQTFDQEQKIVKMMMPEKKTKKLAISEIFKSQLM